MRISTFINPRSNIRIFFLAFLALSLVFASVPVFADFSVNRECQPCEFNVDGHTSCAHGPVPGSEPDSPFEEDAILYSLPIKETGHYYGRGSVNAGTLNLTNISNRSTSTFPSGGVQTTFSGGVLTRPSAHTNQIGLEVALGYFFSKNFRLELEYLVNRNLNYNANPAISLTGIPPFNLAAEVTNNTFLLNGYYDFIFCDFDKLRPFGTVGFGPSFNSVKATITPPFTNGLSSQRTKQFVSIALGGGVGFSYNFCPRWFLTASLRYIYLGTVKIEPDPNFRLQGNYSYLPLSVGLLYIF